MKYIIPDYILDFKCDGRVCKSYCCRKWKIMVDEETKKKYENLPKQKSEAIILNIGEKEGNFYPLKLKDNGFCPFLRDDFLCDLQKNFGEDYLSNICFSYPRITTKVGERVFQSLTLSCEVAARLVLFQKETAFIETENAPTRLGWCAEKKIENEFEDEFFEDILSAGLFILKNNTLSINAGLKMLLKFYVEMDKTKDKIALKKLFNSVEENSFQQNFIENFNKESDYIFSEDCPKLMLTLFNAIYDAPVSSEKYDKLKNIYDDYYKEFEINVIEKNSQVFTNYLMNEFFMRVYPFAFKENYEVNIKVFILSWYAVNFGLFMLYVNNRNLDREGFVLGIRKIVEKLDHGQGVMKKLIEITKTIRWKNSRKTY